jgi:hypothetical protein
MDFMRILSTIKDFLSSIFFPLFYHSPSIVPTNERREKVKLLHIYSIVFSQFAGLLARL